MYDINKIVVFIFVVILLFYMLNLSFFVRQKSNTRTNTFSVLFTGILMCTIATFLDMSLPVFDNELIHIIIKICFTVGVVFYISGVILWGNYTKKIINDLEKLALKDSMTEIFNRNGIEKIYKLISQAKKPFYLGICDLDGLKKINDKFGHLQGDKFIAETVKIIVDAVGTRGYVGRIGGDEFVIIIEYMEAEVLEQIAAHIRKSVSKIFPESNTGISLGYAIFPKEGSTLEELIKIADERMYIDKENRKKLMMESEIK